MNTLNNNTYIKKKKFNTYNSTLFIKVNNKTQKKNTMNKNIKLNKCFYNNTSSKPTYHTSDKNIISNKSNNETSKHNSKYIQSIKKFLLNKIIKSNEKNTEEFESKFLNYELGISDKTSNLTFNLDNNNNNNENVIIEYEKPIEEIEKTAYKILNNSIYQY